MEIRFPKSSAKAQRNSIGVPPQLSLKKGNEPPRDQLDGAARSSRFGAVNHDGKAPLAEPHYGTQLPPWDLQRVPGRGVSLLPVSGELGAAFFVMVFCSIPGWFPDLGGRKRERDPLGAAGPTAPLPAKAKAQEKTI